MHDEMAKRQILALAEIQTHVVEIFAMKILLSSGAAKNQK